MIFDRRLAHGMLRADPLIGISALRNVGRIDDFKKEIPPADLERQWIHGPNNFEFFVGPFRSLLAFDVMGVTPPPSPSTRSVDNGCYATKRTDLIGSINENSEP